MEKRYAFKTHLWRTQNQHAININYPASRSSINYTSWPVIHPITTDNERIINITHLDPAKYLC